MQPTKKYIHDRIVLFLLSVNAFFAVLIGVLTGLGLANDTRSVYTVLHRPTLGLSANTPGNATQMSSLIVFVAIVFILHTVLSVRIYPLRRHFAIVVLGMGTLLILMAGIVSSLLLQR